MKQRWAMGLLALAVSCGGASSTSSTSSAASATSGVGAASASAGGTSSAGAAGATTVPWSQMNHEEKMSYMRSVVMPEMRTLFQEHDAQRFANFTCATCHGANAREVNFHMPNGIAPLDPTQIPGMFQSQDRMHVFMTQRLWPRMTALLGAQPYNPQTHQGFGCLGCHGMRAPAGGAAATPAAAAH